MRLIPRDDCVIKTILRTWTKQNQSYSCNRFKRSVAESSFPSLPQEATHKGVSVALKSRMRS